MRWEQWQADRVLLLGNGPSLEVVDFDRIRADVTVGVNRIHTHPKWKMGWRPDFYITQDKGNNQDWRNDLVLHLNQDYPVLAADRIVFQADSRKALIKRRAVFEDWTQFSNLSLFIHCHHHTEPPERFHPPNLCGFGSSIYVGAQVAMYYWNVKEILLVGCDAGYGVLPGNYKGYKELPQLPDPGLRNRDLTAAHHIMQQEADKRGVRIVNLSPISKIEAHERGDVEEWLDK